MANIDKSLEELDFIVGNCDVGVGKMVTDTGTNTAGEDEPKPDESGVKGSQVEADKNKQELIPVTIPKELIDKGVAETIQGLVSFSPRSIGNLASATLLSSVFNEISSDRDRYVKENKEISVQLVDEKIKNAELIAVNKSESKISRLRQGLVIIGTLIIAAAQRIDSTDQQYLMWILSIVGFFALITGLFFGLDKEE